MATDLDAGEPAPAAIDAATEARPTWWRRPALLAAAGWWAIYLAVWGSGQRFDDAYLGYGWQLVPWDILSDNPLRSVWFLHIQPPLWNLTLGSAGWLSPFTDAITLQFLQAVIGAARGREDAVEDELVLAGGERPRAAQRSGRDVSQPEAVHQPVREHRGRWRERQGVHDEHEMTGVLRARKGVDIGDVRDRVREGTRTGDVV